MKSTKFVSRVVISMLCAVLIFNGLTLNAAGSGELRHEAFLRGGEAIAVALGLEHSSPGPPKGVNPRHSILILPFNNLRQDRSLRGLCIRLGERHLMLDPAGEPKARAALRKLGYPLGPTTR